MTQRFFSRDIDETRRAVLELAERFGWPLCSINGDVVAGEPSWRRNVSTLAYGSLLELTRTLEALQPEADRRAAFLAAEARRDAANDEVQEGNLRAAARTLDRFRE